MLLSALLTLADEAVELEPGANCDVAAIRDVVQADRVLSEFKLVRKVAQPELTPVGINGLAALPDAADDEDA